MIYHNIQRMTGAQGAKGYSQSFEINNDAPAGYHISVRVWRDRPPVESWSLDNSFLNIGARQSVEFAGSYMYITSQYPVKTNTNVMLVKYTEAGVYIDSRDCGSDGGGILGQVNGIYYNREDGLLYVGAPTFPAPADDYVHVYDPSDLSYITKHKVGDYTVEKAILWQGSWWIAYNDPTADFIDRYDKSWVFQKRYYLPHLLPFDPQDGNINGLTVIHGILYANWHEGDSSAHRLTNAYVLADDELLDVGRITKPADQANQDINYCPENGLVYCAERTGGWSSSQHVRVLNPVYAPGELYCDGKCKSDFSDLRVVDPTTDKVLCGEGTGWMEHICGPDHEGNSAFCWLHFTLQDALSAPKALRLDFGDQNATWQDDRASVVEHINDFEDGTVGDFTETYNTVTTVESSTEDSVQGTRSLKWVAPGGGVYCPADTYTDGMLYRIVAWARRVPGQTASDNYLMDASDGLRATIKITEGNASSYDPDVAAWVFLYDPSGSSPDVGDREWGRFEIRNNKNVPETYSGMWIGKGAGIRGDLNDGWITTQSLSPTYTDVLLYGSGYADMIFKLPLVIPEPVVSAVQGIEVQGRSRVATVDMDGDGIPDTVVHYTTNMVITENGNSVNVDLDGDGIADIVLPK